MADWRVREPERETFPRVGLPSALADEEAAVLDPSCRPRESMTVLVSLYEALRPARSGAASKTCSESQRPMVPDFFGSEEVVGSMSGQGEKEDSGRMRKVRALEHCKCWPFLRLPHLS